MQAPTSAVAALSAGPSSHGFCSVHAHAGSALPTWVLLFIHTPLPVSHVPVHQAQRGAYQASQPGATTELGFAGPTHAGSPKDFTLTLGEKLRFIPRIQTS